MQNRSLSTILKGRRRRDPARTELAHDLALFETRSDLTDLAAILDRYNDADADAVRDLVDWSRAA